MKLFNFSIREPFETLPPAWCGIAVNKSGDGRFVNAFILYLRSPFVKNSKYYNLTFDEKFGPCSWLRMISFRPPLKAHCADTDSIMTIYKWPRVYYSKIWTWLPKD